MKNTTPLAQWLTTALAVVLLLTGAVLLFTGPSSVIGFALIAVGAALVIVAQRDKRRRHLGTP